MTTQTPSHIEGALLMIQALLAQIVARHQDREAILDQLRVIPLQIKIGENTTVQFDPLSREIMTDHLAKVRAGAEACFTNIKDIAEKITDQNRA